MTFLKDALRGILSSDELAILPRAFDQVGSIAIFSEFPSELKKKEKLIGEKLIEINKPIETVGIKTSSHSGKFRTKNVRVIAGKKTKITEHKESGVRVKLNVETCYFSPRLSSERLRIAKQVKKNEKVLVLFSGVGIYPLVIAKNSKASLVVGVEWNPEAHKFAEENLLLNKLKNVSFVNKDVAKFSSKEKFDRVIMMLPGGAEAYLKFLPKLAKPKAKIHFYDFQHEGEFDLAKGEIKKVFPNVKRMKLIKAGMYSSRRWRLCVEFKL